jgi:hypothetical protein
MPDTNSIGINEKWRLTKRLENGTIFEILEGETNKPTKVIFQDLSLAPKESYFQGNNEC